MLQRRPLHDEEYHDSSQEETPLASAEEVIESTDTADDTMDTEVEVEDDDKITFNFSRQSEKADERNV